MQSRTLQLPTSETKIRQPAFQQRFSWANNKTNYQVLEDHEIQQENRKILASLRELSHQITMELSKSMQKVTKNPPTDPSTQATLIVEHLKNNLKVIETLTKTLRTYQNRKDELLSGREEQTADQKYKVRQEISKRKQELKQLKLEIKELEKDLVANQQRDIPYFREVVEKMEEQLRVGSTKYANYLKKLKISEEQLTSVVPGPPIYLNPGALDELQKKQSDQYKEYLNIVKLSQILSHRNESDTGKYSRQYGLKIRQLELIMEKLKNFQVQMGSKDVQGIEQKKQIELMKIKIQQQKGVQQDKVLRKQSQSVKNIVAKVHYERATDMEDISEVRKSASKIGSSTDRELKRAFPSRRKISLGQNYYELEPLKSKVEKMISIDKV